MQTANDWIHSHGWLALCGMLLALCSSLTLLGLATGFSMERAAFARGMKVYAVALRPGQLRHEALGTVLFHLVYVPIAGAVLAAGWVHFSSGWAAQLLSFAVPWWGFQFCYYWVHRLMHMRKLRWIHQWHHRSHVTTPMTGLSMHPLEAVLWCVLLLWPPVLLSKLGLLGLGGWMFFLGAHWIGNIAGHANAEIFGFRVGRITSMFYSNPIAYHSLHHARYDRHYGFGTSIMDYIFKTEWPDWPAVHERALHNKPLKTLSEHVDK